MSFSNIYVTPSTSLILIKSLARQPIVYLSTLNVPDFRVSIRDTTGLSTLTTTPIVLSTFGGSRFLDNTTSYLVNQPYGFVNVSLRTSSFWQLLHTSGQTPATAAANVGTTNISTTFFSLLSTASKTVSSLTIENLDTPNSIQLTGPFVVGNLSTPGFILLQSTLNVYGRVSFDKNLYVSGPTQIYSTLTVNSIDTLSSPIFALSSVGVGGSVFVKGTTIVFSTLETRSSIVVQAVRVEKSTNQLGVEVIGNMSVGGPISTLKDLSVGNATTLGYTFLANGPLSSLGGVFETYGLSMGGSLTVQSSILTGATVFFSSLLTQSSLTILSTQPTFSTFSTANITNIVSTPFFTTGLLSSATSFSTAGDFSVLSTLTVLGNLSTNNTNVPNLFSTASVTNIRQSVSTTGNLIVNSSLRGFESATVNGLISFLGIGVGGTTTVAGNVLSYTSMLADGFTIRRNLNVEGSPDFYNTVSVLDTTHVRGNMTVLGTPTINTFNVGSFEVSTLQITTSSPFVALRVSSLQTSTLSSLQVKLAFEPLSGNIQVFTQTSTFVGISSPFSSFTAAQIFTNRFEASIVSSQSLFTSQIKCEPSLLNQDSLPNFEILSKASFPRGFSTPIVKADTSIVTSTFGSFIGDARLLVNLQNPPFSTLSAAIFTASSVTTKVVSTLHANFADLYISTNVIARDSVLFAGPTYFLSTNKTPDPFILQFYSTTRVPTIQPVDFSTLAINNTLFLDGGNRKVGVNISSPRYDLDISGSLYYTGQLYFSSQSLLNLSSAQAVNMYSTFLYSSIYVKDTLVLPSNAGFPRTKFLAVNSNVATLFGLSNLNGGFYIGETDATFGTFPESRLVGIFSLPNSSTISINESLFINNQYKTVTYGVQTPDFLTIEPTAVSTFDFYIEGNLNTSPLLVSTLTVIGKLATSTLDMPTLGLNTSIVSTFNTISTSFFSTTINPILTVNSAAEFLAPYFGFASFHINRSPAQEFRSSLFCVYTDAYVSSATAVQLHAENLFLGTQTL